MERASEKKRNVFPRWRSLAFTLKPEIESVDNAPKNLSAEHLQSRLKFLYEKWRDHPTLENAAEVVDSAVLLKNPYLAVGPAKAILANKNAMPSVRKVAEFVIDGPAQVDLEIENSFDTREVTISSIRGIKKRLIEEPRNSLLLIEKGRLQTQIGDIDGAYHSLLHALAISPEGRESLRAYARFMVHADRSKEGHARLARSERLKHDPWIQAAEIALAQSAENTPKSIRLARNNLRERKIQPIHLSELAAALATFEADEGAAALAKRYFRQSLEDPTENALSQALWVRQEMGIQLKIDDSKLETPRAFEARTRAAITSKKWREALENCKKWAKDEPFSSRATIEGSFIASSFAWSNEDAIALCNFGLIANPNDETLLNNKAVALIRSGKLDEANTILLDMQKHSVEGAMEPFLPATTGLLHFARGELNKGRESYLKAIDIARKLKAPDSQFRAVIHWIYEEIAAGSLAADEIEKIQKIVDETANKFRLNPFTLDIWNVMKEKMLPHDSIKVAQLTSQLPLLIASLVPPLE